MASAAVEHLAGTIGPRLATGPGFRAAADWAAGELTAAGYDVRRQRFTVPAGDSWGVPVAAGRSQNVIAAPPGFDPARPHLVLGAHLDTVAVSPGAEDNASGVGVLLALARTELRARLPVVLVLFGAEEPRGTSDDDHHYGSRHYVAGLTQPERAAVRGMLALDRVGVGAAVPVGSATDEPPGALVRAARRAGVRHIAESGQRSSDHWSFVRAGLPGLRIGSTPYAGYHNARDLPGLVDVGQLDRVGRLVLAWLRG
ncbi:M28 family peptidase [Nocardioides carbamazepini]|uniref:M28 family metallopeptidase n=1 Tax=Nocardioides carbamazepini TaxID=2854259 RepID=UPI002149D566|nr:M28 family peptidase [Nocardioides carbamazepini]MCR1783314.1 M28 family peptidase [Nocardioides carbamazepini]